MAGDLQALCWTLATALMEEAKIDLNKEVEQYAKSLEFGADDEEDLQLDTEEALAGALQAFFGSLPEEIQTEIVYEIRKFAICPDFLDLARWQMHD